MAGGTPKPISPEGVDTRLNGSISPDQSKVAAIDPQGLITIYPVDGGTAVLVHRFRRRFSHPNQQPYRAFFQATRTGPDPDALALAERTAVADERAITAYRAGRACHPLLPFADWAACLPALERLGAVVVADCRDAVAARQLGFVPTYGVSAALAMAEGRAGGKPRIGFLLSPPYFPLRVGG
jgi:hypothetical protein